MIQQFKVTKYVVSFSIAYTTGLSLSQYYTALYTSIYVVSLGA